MKARTLIIDDDDLVRDTLSRMLIAADYEVVDAANGDEGLQAYRSDIFDLVITDILMPVREGLETIRELRRADPEMKIIAISGGDRTSNKMYLNMAEKLGAREILGKPIRRQDLLAKIDAVLND